MILLVSAAAWGTPGLAQDDRTKPTDDGLQRVDGRFDVLDWRPGSTLEQYRRIVILDCFVEFRENWLRDQNRGKRSFNAVTTEDMARIKEILADEFLAAVTEALEADGAYEIVAVAAADVLVLRPAILQLDVGADVYGSRNQLPDMSNGVAMTLYLEFYDSATGVLIGRAVDSEAEPDRDRAATRRILTRWARALRDTIEESNGNQ